jgi:hypothetical protein
MMIVGDKRRESLTFGTWQSVENAKDLCSAQAFDIKCSSARKTSISMEVECGCH